MTKPILMAERGVYTFTFDDNIQIQLDRFQEKGGALSAEITARLTKTAGHLHQARLNLQSTRSRNELRKHLEECKTGVKWGDYLEQVCTMAVQKYREGEPIVRLGGDSEIVAPRYLLYPVIPENQPTVLFGDGGAGKSTTANLFAILASSPWLQNPLGLDVYEQSNTLYLDWETDKGAADWTIKRLLKGMGKTTDYMFYRRCYMPLGADLPEIQKHIMEVDANFVILDSALAACGGDPSSPEVTGQFFRDLRQLNVTSLILAHNSKNSTGDKTIYGSVFWSNFARSVWELKGRQEIDSDSMDIGLFCRKSNISKLFKPIGLKYTYSDSRILVERESLSDVPALSGNLPLWMQIAALIKDGPKEVLDLAETLQTSESSVRGTLNRYKDKFVKVCNKWGLRSEQGRL